MGKIWMPGGGGGGDLDVITAVAPDVLNGKVIVDKDGNPLTGTMPNQGAVNQSLGVNSTYTIPAGYHNGQGKVTQNLATMAAQTINPSASQQTVSSSGKYMTGNVVVNAVSNLSAGNIKKGVVVGGVTGTWEGYVAAATDWYYRGTNNAGFSGGTGITLDTTQIIIGSTGNTRTLTASKSYNLTGYSYIYVDCTNDSIAARTFDIYFTVGTFKSSTLSIANGVTTTLAFPLTNANTTGAPVLIAGSIGSGSNALYVTRIRIS